MADRVSQDFGPRTAITDGDPYEVACLVGLLLSNAVPQANRMSNMRDKYEDATQAWFAVAVEAVALATFYNAWSKPLFKNGGVVPEQSDFTISFRQIVQSIEENILDESFPF